MIPDNWDDEDYLTRYPDVAAAVQAGQFPSGYAHYVGYGRSENRRSGWRAGQGEPLTRACLDPWNYIEISPGFELKPCCKIPPLLRYEKGASASELRDSEPFVALRRQLVTGDLGPVCAGCHIRPMVPLAVLRRMVNAADEDLLRAQPVQYVRVALTTRCNLRCVYCPVSLPGYTGQDLGADDFDGVFSLIADAPPNADVLVNGHGETTYHPDWVKFCEPLIRRGKRLSIITNLGKHLTDEEAACLARFAVIQISLDTADAELLPKIRRKVQLSTIVGNIERIRAAVEAGSGPELSLSCGVYDKNFRGLPELCDFAIAHDVKSITFWQLVKYDDIPGALNVYPIPSLPPEEIAQAVEVMQRTIRILKAARIGVSVAGGFLDEWRKLLPSSGQPAAALAS